jgi:MoxR-like ATPase
MTYVGNRTAFYLAPPEVADIVNLAISLGRPILVEGEPGCGKTSLAYSIASELELGTPVKIAVKSTSRAQDLLYRVNSLARLQDSQNRDIPDARYVFPYLALGPLGAAIHAGRRSVVLIDEVDKADIDFPNDLLEVLDQLTFSIDDLPQSEEKQCHTRNGFGRIVKCRANERPIVVITSNREKRLPEPFLRRCLYIRVTFPNKIETLADIVRKNMPKGERPSQTLLHEAIRRFQEIRTLSSGTVQKLPSTSELIDWVRILHAKGHNAATLKLDPYFPPFWNVLFKTMSDLDSYPAAAQAKKGSESEQS